MRVERERGAKGRPKAPDKPPGKRQRLRARLGRRAAGFNQSASSGESERKKKKEKESQFAFFRFLLLFGI